MSAFYFGPLGAMAPLKVSAGVPVESGRGFSEFVSSGGVRHVQQGRVAPRTWTVGRLWQTPKWVKLLSAASHGLLPDCWLYDVAVARENMVPAQQAAGSGPALLVDGLPMGSLGAGHQVTVPVLAGRLYSLSVWCATPAGVLVAEYRSGSGAWVPVYAPVGEGSRQCAASLTLPVDTTLSVRVVSVPVSGLAVHEGPARNDFYATGGTPCRVAVQDPSRVLQMVTEQTLTDYQVTLLEVGQPLP